MGCGRVEGASSEVISLGEVMDAFWKIFKPFLEQKKWMFIGFIVMVVMCYSLETFGIPHITGKLLSGAGKCGGSNQKNVTSSMKQNLIGLGVIYLFVNLFVYVKGTFLVDLVPKMREHVQYSIYHALLKKYENNYEDIPVGKTLTRLMRTSDAFSDIVIFILHNLLPLMVILLGMCVYFLFLDPMLSLLAFVMVISYVVMNVALGIWTLKTARGLDGSFGKYFEDMNNRINNMLSIFMSGSTEEEMEHQKEKASEFRESFTSQSNRENVYEAVHGGFSVLFFLIMEGVAFGRLKQGKLDISKFASFTIVILFVMDRLVDMNSELPRKIRLLGTAMNGDEMLAKFLNVKGGGKNSAPLDDLLKQGPPNNYPRGSIEFENVVFRYAQSSSASFPVINHMSFSMSPGDRLALVGPSGSGKTTVVKLLMGLLKPEQGSIEVDGIDIRFVLSSTLRSLMTCTNQRTSLFSGTVAENMLYGTGAFIDDLNKLVSKYDLESVFSSLNKDESHSGIYADVGVDGKEASHGMQKVIMNVRCVLRTRINNSPIIILDEPLAGLDKETRKRTIAMIDQESIGKTVIIVTHQPEILEIVDKKIEFSRPKEVNS